METFRALVILGLAVLQVTAEEGSSESKYVSSLHDSTNHQFQNNTLHYEEFNKIFAKKGFYKFGAFNAGFNHYSSHPTLVVFRPVETVNELHGYYLPNGLTSLLAYRKDDTDTFELYRPVREYFLNSSTEALTPYAATFAYPYFYEYPLVKFVHIGEVASDFAVVFVAPKQLRKKDNDDYKEVVRYYTDSTVKVIKEVIV